VPPETSLTLHDVISNVSSGGAIRLLAGGHSRDSCASDKLLILQQMIDFVKHAGILSQQRPKAVSGHRPREGRCEFSPGLQSWGGLWVNLLPEGSVNKSASSPRKLCDLSASAV